MVYSESLARRVRAHLGARTDFSEIKMFGGLCFTVGGNMCCGVVDEHLMLRVGKDAYDGVVQQPHARPMDFTGRPLKGMVYVDPDGFGTDEALGRWLESAFAFADSLPRKGGTPKRGGGGGRDAPKPTHAAKAAAKKAEAGKAAPKKAEAGKAAPKKAGGRRGSPAPKPSTAGPASAPFAGFDKATFRFLKELKENNDKAWFEAHRSEYEAHYVAPALAFIRALGPRLEKLSRTISYLPKVNGSLMRIYRDVRFSKDKTPYKDHLDLWFWEGPNKGWSTPGFFLRLTPTHLVLGTGMHRFDRNQLQAYRAAVLDERAGPALEAHVARAEAEEQAITTMVPSRSRVPRGFDPDHPRACFLLHEGFGMKWEGKRPPAAQSAELVDWCEKRCRILLPVEQWLVAEVIGDPAR